MLARILCVVVLAGAVTTMAVAQQPKPSPSPAAAQPKLGTREATEQALAAYDKARADYEAICDNPQSVLSEMRKSWEVLNKAWKAADEAVDEEVWTYQDVKTPMHAMNEAGDALRKIKAAHKPYDEEFQAQLKYNDAFKAYKKAFAAREATLLKALHDGKPISNDLKKRHAKLDEQRAIDDSRRRAEEEEKAKKNQTSCPQAGGLAGALNNVACKEQHGA